MCRTQKEATVDRFTHIKLTKGGFSGKETHVNHLRDMKQVTVVTVGKDETTEEVIQLEAQGPYTTWKFSAQLPLFLIGEAWRNGCGMEDLADGFGLGNGTMGGDWSGIRDSSEEAYERMFQRALNFLFPIKEE
jgi:hypothetical protein